MALLLVLYFLVDNSYVSSVMKLLANAVFYSSVTIILLTVIGIAIATLIAVYRDYGIYSLLKVAAIFLGVILFFVSFIWAALYKISR